MASNERIGNEALTKLKTFLSRRALLRASAKGAAGLSLAALGGQTRRGSARAAQEATCGGEEITITTSLKNAGSKPAVNLVSQ